MSELIFEVRDAEEGGFWARALGQDIFTQGDSWEELRSNISEAVLIHFDQPTDIPKIVQLHYVRDEMMAIEAA
jgi:predicted RNase H-like HicB family nuclease